MNIVIYVNFQESIIETLHSVCIEHVTYYLAYKIQNDQVLLIPTNASTRKYGVMKLTQISYIFKMLCINK